MPHPKHLLLVAVVVVLFAFSTPAFAQDPQQEETPEPVNVAGEWVMTMDVMEQAFIPALRSKMTLTLTQEGAVLLGSMVNDQGTLDIEGEVEGNEVVFQIVWGDFDDKPAMSFSATVSEDNKSMEGTLEATEGEGKFVVDFIAVRIEG